jgi:uncharacterized membrane protein
VVSGLTLASALGSGLMAGVFFTFSTFVMKALVRLNPAQGIAAMQSINVTAVGPALMTALFGTGAATTLLLGSALLRKRPGSTYLIAGSGLYLAGAMLVTIACNVPRNDALAAVDPTSPDAQMLWTRFVDGWTAWNHVRTVASLGGAALLIAAFRKLP